MVLRNESQRRRFLLLEMRRGVHSCIVLLISLFRPTSIGNRCAYFLKLELSRVRGFYLTLAAHGQS